MLTFEQLKNDVGAWSKVNFQETWSDELPYRWADDKLHNDPDVADAEVVAGLGSVAPLLGIGEEIGELNEAVLKQDAEQVVDAIGDILIYLADWCYRENLPFPSEYSADECGALCNDVTKSISSAYGQLCHGKLKRCQKIRGMDDDRQYREHMTHHMRALMSCLQTFLCCQFISDNEEAYNLTKIANDTWENVVSKRNWKSWPRTGNDHG